MLPWYGSATGPPSDPDGIVTFAVDSQICELPAGTQTQTATISAPYSISRISCFLSVQTDLVWYQTISHDPLSKNSQGNSVNVKPLYIPTYYAPLKLLDVRPPIPKDLELLRSHFFA